MSVKSSLRSIVYWRRATRYCVPICPLWLYGVHQVIGKFKFELEKRQNPKFATFVHESERLPSSRRLELNGYRTKPTTRLGRYNLLLHEIAKWTPPTNPDSETIPIVIDMVTQFLVQVMLKLENAIMPSIFNRLRSNCSSSPLPSISTSPVSQWCPDSIFTGLATWQPRTPAVVKGTNEAKRQFF